MCLLTNCLAGIVDKDNDMHTQNYSKLEPLSKQCIATLLLKCNIPLLEL